MSASTLAKSIITYYRELEPPHELPGAVKWLNPFTDPETMDAVERFCRNFFKDERSRTLILGINPGRFGAGVTGVPFTDPIRLEEDCGIDNAFDKRPELSSEFVYEVIRAYGGPGPFYGDFYISSVSPLGFIKDGKNYNYYDSVEFFELLKPFLYRHMEEHWEWPIYSSVVVNWGKGKNDEFIRRLYPDFNEAPFDDLLSLPHPRWIMQYRRTEKQYWIDRFVDELSKVHHANQQSDS